MLQNIFQETYDQKVSYRYPNGFVHISHFIGGAEIAGVDIAGMDIAAPSSRGGHRRSGH